MTYTTRVLLLTAALLTLSGCASNASQSKPSQQISIAPAINVPYRDVVKNVPDHLGVKVRWGGQIIAAESMENATRLTVLAFPLNANGQPVLEHVEGFAGGRFIVETDAFDSKRESRFLTVFGQISDKETLKNGKFTKTIPVVTALEIKEWSESDQPYAHQRHRLPYNGLGFGLKLGYTHTSYGYYGYDNYRYANLSPFYYPYRGYTSRRYRGRHSR